MGRAPALYVCLFAVSCSLVAALPPRPAGHEESSALLGDKECLEGPAYWCQNFTTAKQCNANRHCIRTVWEYTRLPPDNGEICETCKKMVAEAREELQSNETQENLKLVLEGSCQILIPLKPIARECVKMVDEFIPQLIEALSSQMDPQVVCSVAGLCNSARIDKLLAQYKLEKSKPLLDCDHCNAVANLIDGNFRAASRDQVLNSMLEVCGRMGSFSDGCAATLIVHFNNIYEHLLTHLKPAGICHLSGTCAHNYHFHAEDDKSVAVSEPVKLEGDMPCDLCEQLVQHLRDILVANTTETEFEQVLLGICAQTQGFKKECINLVETYYPAIYSILTTELDPKFVCTQIGICPKNLTQVYPLSPLVPAHVAQKLDKSPSSGLHRVPVSTSGVSVHTGIHSLQVSEPLPKDVLLINPGSNDKQLCQMCEYFLHFVQQEVTDPKTEQEIIKSAENACSSLPDKFSPMCRSFVDTYTAAVIAILAQDIDPSQVCPAIGVCPGFTQSQVQCSPCKTSTSLLIQNIGTNTTEASIKRELMSLCLNLEYEDSRHCSRMLNSHHEDLADMVTAEFTGEEMCYYMKYCTPTSSSDALAQAGVGNVETNEIPTTLKDEAKDKDLCVLCEFIFKTLEKDLQDNKTEEEIRVAVEHVCMVMPKTVRPKCKQFIDQYADLIITLLAQSVQPDQICQMIGLCTSVGSVNMDYVKKSMSTCVVCESLMGALQGVIADPNIQRDINHQLDVACLQLPQSMRRECQDIVHQMAPQIEAILEELPVGVMVCKRLQLCGHSASVDLVSTDRCSEGHQYWCQSTMHAATCQKIEFCQNNIWLAEKPNQKSQFRAKYFTY